jgi:hypothetical protein
VVEVLYIQESTDIGAEDVYGSVRQEVTVDEEQWTHDEDERDEPPGSVVP